MEGKEMSKSIGKLLGSGNVGRYGSESNYLNLHTDFGLHSLCIFYRLWIYHTKTL